MSKKVTIIGGGPGGYVAAIRAAQLGAEVTLVEQEKIGGTCLNVGCIPTKALLHTAELYRTLLKGHALGLKVDNLQIDWPALQNRKGSLINRLVKGVETLLKANKVTVKQGIAHLKNKNTVEVAGEELAADVTVLATGSEPARLRFPGAHLPGVIDSTEALRLSEVPQSMVIIGGGVIGVELAALYSSLGSEVTVVELLPQILPTMDSEIAGRLRQDLSRQGVTFLTDARLMAVEQRENGLAAQVTINEKTETVTGQYVLVAVGRTPRTMGLGFEEAGIVVERGRIVVDVNFVTSVPGIYAVGDCNGQLMLAHAASAQGIAAVEHALGHKPEYCRDTIPACIYTTPEVAAVGLTEDYLKEKNIAYQAGTFGLIANGKALIEGGQTGLVKVLAATDSGKILGVHMIGPRATELIAEGALAIRMGATANDLITTIHAHPSISEAVGEAALAVKGLAIHLPPKK